MKSSLLFWIGAVVDGLIVLISVSNLLMMRQSMKGIDPAGTAMPSGLSTVGQLLVWLIPALLIILIAAAFWLKNAGKVLAANILLWIPALPMVGGIIIWGGLAIIFILFSAGK